MGLLLYVSQFAEETPSNVRRNVPYLFQESEFEIAYNICMHNDFQMVLMYLPEVMACLLEYALSSESQNVQ